MPENCLKRGKDTEMQFVPMDDWGTQVTVKSSRTSLDHHNKKEEVCKTPHLPPNQEYLSRKKPPHLLTKKEKKEGVGKGQNKPNKPPTP